MPDARDAGALGQLISLAGVRGRAGLGLVVGRPAASLTFTTGVQVLGANPARRWALIQNVGTGDITIAFDEGAASTFVLTPDAVLQIDAMLPWTGSVYARATSGVVTYIEASIQAGG